MGKVLAWGAGLSLLLVFISFFFRNQGLAYSGAALFWVFVLFAIMRKFFRWLAR